MNNGLGIDAPSPAASAWWSRFNVSQSIFSIDVEDWFNLSGTGHEPPPAQWDSLESRVERNFRSLLALLAAGGGTATCFFIGYFAKRFPHLVHEAIAAGHEIASHSYFHRLVYEMTSTEFYEDALASRKLLEDISGRPVHGYRAPAFSVTERTPWFFDKLAEAGYRYDSSVFPARHQTGGLAASRFEPHEIATSRGAIMEFPITVVRTLGTPMCFFGGGYLRLFPYRLVHAMGLRALSDGRPIVFYIHPREIDPDHPRMPLSRRRTFTSYVNLRTTRGKIQKILRDFQVSSFDQYVAHNGAPIARRRLLKPAQRELPTSHRNQRLQNGRARASAGHAASPDPNK